MLVDRSTTRHQMEPSSKHSVGSLSPARGLIALVLCGVLLRLQIVVAGPLIPDIRADLGGAFVHLGLLTTIPVVLMGVFGLLAMRVVTALGTLLTITLALAAISVAALLRAGTDGLTLLLLMTVPIGIGTGLAAATVPAMIKETHPGKPARATGAHAAGLILGAGIAAASAVPLASALGSWRGGLFAIALASAIGTIVWVILVRGRRGTTFAHQQTIAIPWRHAWAAGIVLLFSLQALVFWGTSTWIAPAYQQLGWSARDAGYLAGVLNTAPLAGAIWISAVGDRLGSRRRNLVVASAITFAGTTLLAAYPQLAVPGALLTGAGLGALLALTMALPLDVSNSPREAAGLTALMYVIGFGAAAVTPTVLGALADVTGSFWLPLWTMSGASLTLVIAGRWGIYSRLGTKASKGVHVDA